MHKDPYILSSLDSALRVLDILRVREGVGVSEVSRLARVGKSSAFNILHTLERRGYVRKTPDARYFLGAKLQPATDSPQDRSLQETALPVVRRLVKRTGQTSWLGVLNINGRVLAIISEEGYLPDSPPARLGLEGEATCVAPGKVLLAHSQPRIVDDLLRSHRPKRYTEYTLTGTAAIHHELVKVRAEGFASDFNERYLGYGNLAVPVFDGEGRCVASLSVVGTVEKLSAEQDELVTQLRLAAEELEALL